MLIANFYHKETPLSCFVCTITPSELGLTKMNRISLHTQIKSQSNLIQTQKILSGKISDQKQNSSAHKMMYKCEVSK